MHIDMSAFCGQNSLMSVKHTINDSSICLGSSDEEIYPRIRGTACFLDQFPCMGRVGICTIACSLLCICVDEMLQHQRMSTCHIIRIKIYHDVSVIYKT